MCAVPSVQRNNSFIVLPFASKLIFEYIDVFKILSINPHKQQIRERRRMTTTTTTKNAAFVNKTRFWKICFRPTWCGTPNESNESNARNYCSARKLIIDFCWYFYLSRKRCPCEISLRNLAKNRFAAQWCVQMLCFMYVAWIYWKKCQ